MMLLLLRLRLRLRLLLMLLLLLLLRFLRRQATTPAATASRYPGPRSHYSGRGAGWNGSFSVTPVSNFGRRRRLNTGGPAFARGRVAWS